MFDLELDVEAHAASLPETGETATTSTGRSSLGLGDEVTFRARHLRFWWTMTTKVTVYERPHGFVDEQIRGPFLALRHEHVFEALDGGSTRMTDRMSAVLPLGPLGRGGSSACPHPIHATTPSSPREQHQAGRGEQHKRGLAGSAP